MLLGAFFLAAIFVGLLLAGAPILLILALVGFAWLILLPYHAEIATTGAMMTFSSGFIVPGLPGRPLAWEAAALLGWTGVAIALALRRVSPDAGALFRRHRLLFFGAIAYCGVLIALMYFRGVGIRVFGGSQMGGRIYMQQLACAIFPLLFILKPMDEKRMLKLYTIQCVLALSFLPADFAFTYGGKLLEPLLYFLELPTDGLNFEAQAQHFGIRRFQSFFFVSLALICLLVTRKKYSDFFTRAGLWMWPAAFGLLALGLGGGHRNLLLLLAFVLPITAWTQRFFTPIRVVGIVLVAGLCYLGAATFVRDLPLSAQRALSSVPGLEVDRQASEDGQATLNGRRAMRAAGFEMAKDYRWLGRGFGKPLDVRSAFELDQTQWHMDLGIFYNGTVGILVNTGIPGTIAMFSFLGGGTLLAIRILRHVRRHGADDPFSRMASVLSALWIGQFFSFVFLHGDSEFAMRTFGLQAGMLLLCDYNFGQRLKAAAEANHAKVLEEAGPVVPEELSVIRSRGTVSFLQNKL